MKFTVLGNAPFTPTGYGQQLGMITPRLVKAGHSVGVIANYGHQGSVMDWKGVKIFGSSFHINCMDVIHGHSKNFDADFLMTLIDLQVMDVPSLLDTKWVAWFPLDHQNMPAVILDNLKHADFRITMSKHASSEMDKTGLEYEYIPCAIDLDVFKPLDMAESREEMGIPLDKFVVGMVAMNKGNPSRKAFLQNIAAFAALQKKHGDCVMYLHTGDGLRFGIDGAVNLVEYVKALGLSYGYAFSGDNSNKDVIFANQYGLSMGYEPPMMAKLYSAMDVHLLVTMGEGFGIPIIEAQACGTPVIVGDWTAAGELCFSGWKVDKTEAEPTFTNLNAFQYMPRAAPIAERLEMAYQMRGNQDYRKRAVQGVKPYGVEKLITDKWLPILDKALAKIQEQPRGFDESLGMLR